MSDDYDLESLLEESFEDPDNLRMLQEKLNMDEEELDLSTRDYPKVQRELDLHGHTKKEALFALNNFLNHCIVERVMTIRIITGKGLHSQYFKPILPQIIEQFLSQSKKEGRVFSFKKDSSGGAYLVYLVS